jgi:integrase
MSLTERREAFEMRVVAWRKDAGTWSEALEAWLAATGSEHTRAAYATALRQFIVWRGGEAATTIADARPWSLTASQVRAWRDALLKQGLARSTVNARLAALGSFFSFCQQQFVYVDEDLLLRRSLVDTSPVDGVERLKVKPRPRVALEPEQVRALLSAQPRHSVVGLRNRALLLCYLLTGRRNSEIRTLTWGDLREEGERVFYRWQGKRGKGGERELPRPAYAALLAYLQAAGRLESIEDDDYLFTSLEDVASRFEHVDAAAMEQPLTAQRVNQIVKAAAKAAGLKDDLITCHTLRRTAGRRFYEESGHDLDKTQWMLDHGSPATTAIYLNQPRVESAEVWQSIAEMYGLFQ